MNHEEASDYYMHLRRAVEEVKRCIRLAEKGKGVPKASLNTALELLVACEIGWNKTLKKHQYDAEIDI